MSGQQNPFTPGLGTHPPVVIGRNRILADIGEAYANPGWHRYSNVSMIAHRGTGKTVLLNEIHGLAADEGWLVVTEDAGRKAGSFVDRMATSLREFVASRKPPTGRRVTSGSASALGFSLGIDTSLPDPGGQPLDLRRCLGEVMDMGPDRPTGVLMTVDEVHKSTAEDINDFGNVVQHLQNERQPVAMVLAGLPVEEGKEPTFLARCKSLRFLDLTTADVELGLIRTAAMAGLSFEEEALTMAVEATAGHPYMMQLAGWHSSRSVMRRNGQVITTQDVLATLDEAREELKLAVLVNVGYALSKGDRVFLAAMALDSGPTQVQVLQLRLGLSPQAVNKHLGRLMKAEMVQRVERGVYDFAIPGYRAEMRGSEEYQALS